MIAKQIYDQKSKESFSFKEPYPISTMDGRVPVMFAGQSGEGDIYETYETPKRTLFLVRYGTKTAERIGSG